MAEDCIFCKIANKEMEAEIVEEGDRVIAFRDISAQAPTHVQVIPKEHVARIGDFEAGRDREWLVEMFETAVRIASREGLEDGYRLVMNNGALAGQSVPHVHLHLLGGRRLKWPPG